MGHEQLTALIVIQAPRVAAAMSENLKLKPSRMISPNPGTQFELLLFGGIGLADAGVVEHALNAIKPAVRPPQEAVQTFMRVLIAKARQQDLGRSVRHV